MLAVQNRTPYFNSAYEEYKDDIEFMMINLTDGLSETTEKVKDFVSEKEYSFPVYYDTESSAASAYETMYIPSYRIYKRER